MASAASTLVLLHGLGLDSRMWDRVVPSLRDRNPRLVTIDLPGHGKGERLREEARLEALAERVALVIAELPPPIHLVGFSMGGMLAMRIALQMKLAALTLMSTSGEPEPHRDRYEKMAAFFRGMPPSVEGADAYLALQMRPDWAAAHPDVREHYRRIVMESDRDGVYFAACAVIRRENMLERLRDLRVPTVIIAGEGDIATPIDHGKRLAAAIPDARLLTLPNAPHLLHEEHPDEVIELLAREV